MWATSAKQRDLLRKNIPQRQTSAKLFCLEVDTVPGLNSAALFVPESSSTQRHITYQWYTSAGRSIMNLVPGSLKRAGELWGYCWKTMKGWGGKCGSHRWRRASVDPGVDTFLIFTIFLQSELLGSRAKPGCTPAVMQDGLYNYEIKITASSRGANQGDYIDMSLVSSNDMVPLHGNLGAEWEIWFSSKWANIVISWNSSLSNLICGLINIYLFNQHITFPVQWTEVHFQCHPQHLSLLKFNFPRIFHIPFIKNEIHLSVLFSIILIAY